MVRRLHASTFTLRAHVTAIPFALTALLPIALLPAALLRAALLFAALVVALVSSVALAHPAAADDAVVVLDRGRAAQAGARHHERMALHLVELLNARGMKSRLVLYGTRPDGRVRAAPLSGDLEDRLSRAAAKEGWRYEAGTDPRHALAASIRSYEGTGPLLILLVGPFAGAAPGSGEGGDDGDEGDSQDDEGEREADEPSRTEEDVLREAKAAEALAAWEKAAPQGTRVFAPDLSRVNLARIAEARGVLSTSAIVLDVGEPVAIIDPWSPLAVSGAEAALRATVQVPLEVWTSAGGSAPRVLRAVSSDGLSEVALNQRGTGAPGTDAPEAGAPIPGAQVPGAQEPGKGQDSADAGPGAGPLLHARSLGQTLTFVVTRPHREDAGAARVETISFEPSGDPAALWLAAPPQPRTIQWTRLRPDARVSWFVGRADRPHGTDAPVDGARPLDADPLLVGRPLARVCRIEHTRVGDVPLWRVTAVDAEQPDGLTIALGDVVNLTDEIAYRDLEVRFAARPGEPGTFEGTLAVESAGHPRRFLVPYRVAVPPGRIVARLDAPEAPLRLPAGEDAGSWTLVVEEMSPNAPQLVRLEAVLDPPSLASILTARLAGSGSVDVAWDLAGPLEVRPGRRYALAIDLAPGVRTAEGTIALRLPAQRGVEGQAEGVGRIVGRSPRLVVAEGTWAYRMDGGEVVADPPLVLEVDPDGGGGDWRLALLETTPTVAVEPGAPVTFALRPEGPGRWAVVPQGRWSGVRGSTFSARSATVPLKVTWTPGGASGGAPGSVPDRVTLQIEVRPRWGRAGWILVGLAALALALGLWGLLQMRAAPVGGTLLYQVEGRAGTVGRLDLAPVGRRAAHVSADDAGRLSVDTRPHRASSPVVIVRPTRVGGFLELPAKLPPERHLLVDGLTVLAGRHRIRYVSAQPGDATVPAVEAPIEELLGPEFDISSGRIDALEAQDPPASDPD